MTSDMPENNEYGKTLPRHRGWNTMGESTSMCRSYQQSIPFWRCHNITSELNANGAIGKCDMLLDNGPDRRPHDVHHVRSPIHTYHPSKFAIAKGLIKRKSQGTMTTHELK